MPPPPPLSLMNGCASVSGQSGHQLLRGGPLQQTNVELVEDLADMELELPSGQSFCQLIAIALSY